MTSISVAISRANDPLSVIGEVLVQVGAISLHLQARAQMHDRQGDLALADPGSAIARATFDARANLAAMSRYCLQYLVPRTQSLMMQVESVAKATSALAENPSELRSGMSFVASQMDRCCSILRGHARTWPRGAGIMRLSEQRLWGALAAELHRVEGSDGPVMRSCGEIERIAFDLGNAIAVLLEERHDLPMEQRRDLGIALIEATRVAGTGTMPDLSALARFPAGELPALAQLIERLRDESDALARTTPQVAAALAIATEASAHTQVATRLEGALRDLDKSLGEFAGDYRKQARLADRPGHRGGLVSRLKSDARIWNATAVDLSISLSLSQEVADFCGSEGLAALRETDRKSTVRA